MGEKEREGAEGGGGGGGRRGIYDVTLSKLEVATIQHGLH